nr:P-loop NTPase fold protein [Neorhizobium sp. T6_25]
MRHSDRPISLPDDDVLGRSEFALALARSIDQLSVARDGFVIGLIGAWGSGKSSVVELTLRYLKHIEMSRADIGAAPSLLELDEMSRRFSRVEPITQALIAENRDVDLWDRNHRDAEFRKAFDSEEDTEFALNYWRLKRFVENNPKNIVVRFSPWLFPGKAELASALISDLARAIGEKLGSDVREAFASVLSRLSQAVPLAGAATDVVTGGAFGGFFSASVDLSDRLAKRLTTGPTLEGVRDRLRYTLRALEPKKIIVVVDDLDRLTPPEAVEMVSLLKGLGDLPNVVYVLCYDEERLSALIGTALQLDGIEYLQKIIQYPVHLPPLDTTDISRLLEVDLQELIPALQPNDQTRLSAAWFSILRRYLLTPRDVRRLMNAFSVASAGLGDHTDPIDLLILETIRIHEPSIYHWFRQNLDQLVV